MLEPVPPLGTERIPVISLEPFAKEIAALYKLPPEDLTLPVPREDIVVEPVTLRLPVTDVVAKEDVALTFKVELRKAAPLADRPVVEAFAKVVNPETVKPVVEAFAKVVCPVTFKVELRNAALATVKPVVEALPVDTPESQE